MLTLDNTYVASWSPHPHNVALQIDTWCPGTFMAQGRWEVEPTDTQLTVHRVTPPDPGCSVTAYLIRNPTDDPEQEVVGELVVVQ